MEKESNIMFRCTAVVFLLVLSALSSVQITAPAGAAPTSGFEITRANPSSLTVTLGRTNSSIITVQKSGAFNGVLALTATAVPPILVVSMEPSSISFTNGNSARSTLEVSTGPLTLPGTYNITVVATDGIAFSTKNVPVNIPFPDFMLQASPIALTVAERSSNVSQITIAGKNGFSGDVSLQVSSTNNGPSVGVNPPTVTILLGNSAMSMLTVSTTCDTIPGLYDVRLTGSSVGFSDHSIDVSVTVTLDSSCHLPFTVTLSCGSAIAAKPVTCDASPNGGAQPYAFSWHAPGGNPETGTGTDSTFTTRFATKGTYTVSVTVTDSFGTIGSGSSAVTVVAQPLTIIVNCGIAIATEPVSCDATITGGTTPYAVAWSATSGIPSTGQGNSFTTTFAVKGTDTVSAIVTDANDVTQMGSITFAVVPQALVASFTFSPAFPVSHEMVTFVGNAIGGTEPYSFNWNFGDSTTETGATVSHAYVARTTAYHVVLTMTDVNGVSSTTYKDVSVSQYTISVSVGCSSAISGEPVNCTAIASGGFAPITISWFAPNGTSTTGTGASFTTTFNAKGSYTVTATATDTYLVKGSKSIRVTISAQMLSIDFSFSPASPSSGQPVTFTATGAAPSYQLGWNFGDGAVGIGSPVQHTYTVNPTTSFNVTLTAVNAFGSGTVSHIVTVTVSTGSSTGNPPAVKPTPTSPSPLNPLFGFNWPLAALVAGNLLMAALVLTQVPALRKRLTRKETPS